MFQWVALILSLGTVVGGVIYWIRSYTNAVVAERERASALRMADEQLAATERAAAAEKLARDRVFDAEKSAVRDAAGAADLLRRQFPGPGVTAPVPGTTGTTGPGH